MGKDWPVKGPGQGLSNFSDPLVNSQRERGWPGIAACRLWALDWMDIPDDLSPVLILDGSPVEGYGTCCAKVVIEDVVIMVDNVSDPEGGKRCLHTHNQV